MATGVRDRNENSLAHRIMWMILVVLIPLVVTAAMVAGALQFLGVPVWQSAVKVIHPSSAQTNSTAAGTSAQLTLKTQLASAQSKNTSLTSQVQSDEQKIAQLQQQNRNLQKQLSSKAGAKSQALQQASILKGMDPSAAAQVLAKLPAQNAANIIAVMAPSDSGPILAQMPASEAGKLMTLSSQVQFPTTTANSTGSGTTSTTSNATTG